MQPPRFQGLGGVSATLWLVLWYPRGRWLFFQRLPLRTQFDDQGAAKTPPRPERICAHSSGGGSTMIGEPSPTMVPHTLGAREVGDVGEVGKVGEVS